MLSVFNNEERLLSIKDDFFWCKLNKRGTIRVRIIRNPFNRRRLYTKIDNCQES